MSFINMRPLENLACSTFHEFTQISEKRLYCKPTLGFVNTTSINVVSPHLVNTKQFWKCIATFV